MPIQIRACVLCEQARPELYDKFTLLGFFGLAPLVTVAIANFQLPVTICFVFMGEPFVGRVQAGIRVLSGTGAVIPSDIPLPPPAEFPRDRPLSNYFMQFQGRFPGPGGYTAILTVNGEDVHTAAFGLRQALPRPGH